MRAPSVVIVLHVMFQFMLWLTNCLMFENITIIVSVVSYLTAYIQLCFFVFFLYKIFAGNCMFMCLTQQNEFAGKIIELYISAIGYYYCYYYYDVKKPLMATWVLFWHTFSVCQERLVAPRVR